MKRREFLKLPVLAPVPILGLSAASLPESSVERAQSNSGFGHAQIKMEGSIDTQDILGEYPETAEELTGCIEKYTEPGGEYDKAYVDIDGERRSFATYGMRAGGGNAAEKKLVKSLWTSVREMIDGGNQKIYWRVRPALYVQKKGLVALHARFRLEPYHTDTGVLDN